MTPTANQMYKSSGSTLPFKEWIEREKEKGTFMKNSLLEGVTDFIKERSNDNVKPSSLQTNKDASTTDLGMPKWVLYAGVATLVLVIGYKMTGSK